MIVSKLKPDYHRKEYMAIFKDMSSAKASRDLRKGMQVNLIEKIVKK